MADSFATERRQLVVAALAFTALLHDSEAARAELTTLLSHAHPSVRCEAIVRRVEELFPGAGDADQAQFWTGLRPTTPSNLPVIGKSKLPNLFLNTGHGTLGWTMSCGSARVLSDLIDGRTPDIDTEGLSMARYG